MADGFNLAFKGLNTGNSKGATL